MPQCSSKDHLLENTDSSLKLHGFELESPKGGAPKSVILTKAYSYYETSLGNTPLHL